MFDSCWICSYLYSFSRAELRFLVLPRSPARLAYRSLGSSYIIRINYELGPYLQDSTCMSVVSHEFMSEFSHIALSTLSLCTILS